MKTPDAKDADPAEAASQIQSSTLERMQEGLKKLAVILQRNGFKITDRDVSGIKIVLHRRQKEEVILSINGDIIHLLTNDHGTPGDSTFRDEVMDAIQRESSEFPSRGDPQFLGGGLWGRIIAILTRK